MADAKQGKSPIEDFYNGSSQSRVVLAKPRLGGFGSSSFGSSSSKSCNTFGSVLRPAQLKPGSNPFLKVSEATGKVETKNDDKADSSLSISTEDRLKDSQEDPEAPKFVPLGSTSVTQRTANSVPAPVQPPATSSTGFVFGQNLSERVVINENLNNGEASLDHGSTNGTTDLLFTNAAASVKDNVQEEAGPSESGGRGGSGLAEAAAEYERSHAQPPPPTTNYTTTGEEGEINVLQISCRLFAWESGSWRERGRGVLRLNEASGGGGGGAARLVGRVAGSLRVVLNTRIWPDMVVERAAAKSLRITAADAQHQIKLFLIMGAPGDITQLNRALLSRIAVTKRISSCAQNSASHRAAERLEAAVDELEYLDKASDDAFAQDDESSYDDKPCEEPDDVAETAENDRLDTESQSTDDTPRADDNIEEKETKALKRKEPAEDETSPKRQCPQIIIE